MQLLDFGALVSWRGVDRDTVVQFEAEERQYRLIELDVIAPEGTEAHVIVGESYLSLGPISGLVTLRYGLEGGSGLAFELPDGVKQVLVRTKADPLVISDTGAVSLTKAEPRKASGVEQEMRRLMMLMQHRNDERMAEREREFNRRLLSASVQSGGAPPEASEVIEEGGDGAATAE